MVELSMASIFDMLSKYKLVILLIIILFIIAICYYNKYTVSEENEEELDYNSQSEIN